MAQRELQGKRIAILAAEGVEEVELVEPRIALEEAGAETVLVSPESEKVRSWNFTEWGDEYEVDTPLAEARAEEFDALFGHARAAQPEHSRRRPAPSQLARHRRSVEVARRLARGEQDRRCGHRQNSRLR